MGIAGPDQGAGGKYLFLPPGHDGDVPDGYFTYRCPTFTNWVVLRALGGVPAMKQTRIYPLAQADSPDENVFVNLAEQVVQHRARQRLLVLRGARRARPGGAGRGARRRAGRPARGDRHRQGPARSHPTTGCGRSSRRPPRSAAAWPGRSPTRRATRTRSSTARGRTLRRRQPRVPARRRTAARRPDPVPLPRHRRHSGHGARPGRRRLRLRLHGPRQPTATCSTARGPTGCTSTPTRRRRTSGPSTSTTPRPARCSRSPSTIYPALASNSGTLQANDDGSHDLYFGPEAPAGQGAELGRDHPRQVLVPALPPLRPAPAVVRPDLAAQRVRAHRLSARVPGQSSGGRPVRGVA